MKFIIIGCLAFVFLYLFDFNKIILLHKFFNIFFAIGVALLVFSTLGILFGNFARFELTFILRLFFGVLSACSLFLMLYALFFALPFRKTYVDVEKENPVVDTGMYALCRHPGVVCFFFFYLFLGLASGILMMIWATLVWTVMDIIHVYVQDRWLFPETLKDYEIYKGEVPFLLPNRKSLRKFATTL